MTSNDVAPPPGIPAVGEGAREVAQCWGMPWRAAVAEGTPCLWMDTAGLTLGRWGERAGRVRVDFLAGPVGYRLRHGDAGQAVARAVGVRAGRRPRVLDLTAGLGGDAMALAALGCTVWMVERIPQVAALLDDGLRRAAERLDWVPERLRLVGGEARVMAPALAAALRPEVVYLDPMYPEGRRRAAARKEMALFRNWFGGDDDADDLLSLALSLGARRVVVKRPRKAPPMAGRPPDASRMGRSTRFDLYGT